MKRTWRLLSIHNICQPKSCEKRIRFFLKNLFMKEGEGFKGSLDGETDSGICMFDLDLVELRGNVRKS